MTSATKGDGGEAIEVFDHERHFANGCVRKRLGTSWGNVVKKTGFVKCLFGLG